MTKEQMLEIIKLLRQCRYETFENDTNTSHN